MDEPKVDRPPSGWWCWDCPWESRGNDAEADALEHQEQTDHTVTPTGRTWNGPRPERRS